MGFDIKRFQRIVRDYWNVTPLALRLEQGPGAIMKLGEEVGELTRSSIRLHGWDLRREHDPGTTLKQIEQEIGDVAVVLSRIATIYNIDLEKAIEQAMDRFCDVAAASVMAPCPGGVKGCIFHIDKVVEPGSTCAKCGYITPGDAFEPPGAEPRVAGCRAPICEYPLCCEGPHIPMGCEERRKKQEGQA